MQIHAKSSKIMDFRQHSKKEKMQISPHPNVSEKNLTPQKVSSCSKQQQQQKKKNPENIFFCPGNFWIFWKKPGFFLMSGGRSVDGK